MRISAAEKPFGKREFVGRFSVVVKDGNIADFGAARQHHSLADGIVTGIADQHSCEIALRAQDVFGHSEIDSIIDAAVRIERIVAAVLHEVEAGDADADGLREQRQEQRIDLEIRRAHFPIASTPGRESP